MVLIFFATEVNRLLVVFLVILVMFLVLNGPISPVVVGRGLREEVVAETVEARGSILGIILGLLRQRAFLRTLM